MKKIFSARTRVRVYIRFMTIQYTLSERLQELYSDIMVYGGESDLEVLMYQGLSMVFKDLRERNRLPFNIRLTPREQDIVNMLFTANQCMSIAQISKAVKMHLPNTYTAIKKLIDNDVVALSVATAFTRRAQYELAPHFKAQMQKAREAAATPTAPETK